MVGERAQPEVIERIRKELGTDRNLAGQYFGYVKLLLHGEFGRSYYTNRKVFDDLLLKFPNTLRLAACAMTIAVPFGLLVRVLFSAQKGHMGGQANFIDISARSERPGLLERSHNHALPEP